VRSGRLCWTYFRSTSFLQQLTAIRHRYAYCNNHLRRYYDGDDNVNHDSVPSYYDSEATNHNAETADDHSQTPYNNPEATDNDTQASYDDAYDDAHADQANHEPFTVCIGKNYSRLKLTSFSTTTPGCGIVGYTKDTAAYYFDSSGTKNTFAACSAACKADAQCQSFGYGEANCLLFTVDAYASPTTHPSQSLTNSTEPQTQTTTPPLPTPSTTKLVPPNFPSASGPPSPRASPSRSASADPRRSPRLARA
jgi:hypothetical protein